jgi:DNA segregation ATPase FtsK/SpoIIIE-like protein
LTNDNTAPLTLVELEAQAIQQLISQPLSTEGRVQVIQESTALSIEEDADKEADSISPVASTLTNDEIEPGSSTTDMGPVVQDIQQDLVSPVPTALSLDEREKAVSADPVILSNELRTEAEDLARLFRRSCQSYRIQLEECDPNRAIVGPTVWRFYVRLARGQRIDALRNALEDIGREMRRSGLLISTLSNSDEIALDVPRTIREIVPLARGLACLPSITSPEQMPIAIGVSPEGIDLVRDLGEMPHILIGGTTGAGKTVFLYGLLSAILTTHPDPTSLRLLLSTSKPEDFVYFEGLPHLETGQIISNVSETIELLETYIGTALDNRLDQLRAARCRDIIQYNAQNPASPIPPMVVLVDEFADLADQLAGDRVAKDTFYTSLRRVAQLGRNRGIHLVLCTQRPSADLVPTSIRTLMNARVALRVNDGTASRMILDENGAEQLQLHGDLLFKDQVGLIRAQGYFVTTTELDNMMRRLMVGQ